MNYNYLKFKTNSPEVKQLINWWEELDRNYRGERAYLRRCNNLTEVYFSPSYHRLRRMLLNIGRVEDNSLSLVVGVSARVKTNDDFSGIAQQMASGKADNSARVNGLRFRRLLKIKDRDEFFKAMRRIIALLGGAVNLQSLARSLYLWHDKYIDIRKEWAFEYYSTAPDEK